MRKQLPLLFCFLLCFSLNCYIECSEEFSFELLKGTVDDCCCSYGKVFAKNQKIFHPLISQIAKRDFFKFFRVDYLKECPFWVEDYVCGIEDDSGCSICECSDDELPKFWDQPISDTLELKTDITEETFCEEDCTSSQWIQEEETGDEVILNLQKNPPKFTNYSGVGANRIWLAIYNENCFNDYGECREMSIFYKLFSGLHGDITLHIAEKYIKNGKTEPNVDFYYWKLHKYPDRISNVFFTYLFLLRSVQKAREYLDELPYPTISGTPDLEAQKQMKLFTKSLESCSPGFDESGLFSEIPELKEEMMKQFRNISKLFDCVSCVSCRVHAKLQLLGIATSVRILFAPNTENVVKTLKRNEISALINTVENFSSSIAYIGNMEKRLQERNEKEKNNKKDQENSVKEL
ncbi:ero1-like protein [Anaeramoeba flamelloides]|uniref:Ero1-like protein n=1 Tax=Anaeramoeba flamelloides TaxID=1746091 RepID=A0ABQ8X642_9EUKA|nr:ero1-like protein [Anaeramoeba flamelloides]